MLADVKAFAEQRGATLGETISALLAQALTDAQTPNERPPFRWSSQPIVQLVDLEDKEAVERALDADGDELPEVRVVFAGDGCQRRP